MPGTATGTVPGAQLDALALWVALYFVAAMVALGWLLIPAWRRAGLRAVGRLRRPMPAVLATLLLLALPALLLLIFRPQPTLEAYDDRVAPADSDRLVAQLLQGEQLVPPPPLPPEVFVTAAAQEHRPELVQADRKWARLDPEFTQRLLLAFRIMREQHGYEMVLLEGYRSPERQAALQQMGAHVTRAGAYQSYHQFGLAADCAFLRDGRLVISERDPWAMRGYQLYGEVAESLGLTWGGRWQMMDFGHVEWRKPGVRLGQPG